MSWQVYGNWAFSVAAGAAVLFALLYFVLAPWWSTVGGRNTIALMGTMALAFSYFCWVIWLGGVPAGFYPTRALLFTLLAASTIWRIVIFIRHHILRSLRDPEPEREDAR